MTRASAEQFDMGEIIEREAMIKKIRENISVVYDLSVEFYDLQDIKTSLVMCVHFLDTLTLAPLGLLKLHHTSESLRTIVVSAYSSDAASRSSKRTVMPAIITDQAKRFRDLISKIGDGLYCSPYSKSISAVKAEVKEDASALKSALITNGAKSELKSAMTLKEESEYERGKNAVAAFVYWEIRCLKRYLVEEEHDMLYSARHAFCVKQVEEVTKWYEEAMTRLDSWMFETLSTDEKFKLKMPYTAMLEFVKTKANEYSDPARIRAGNMKVEEFVNRLHNLSNVRLIMDFHSDMTPMLATISVLDKFHPDAIILSGYDWLFNRFNALEFDMKKILECWKYNINAVARYAGC